MNTKTHQLCILFNTCVHITIIDVSVQGSLNKRALSSF